MINARGAAPHRARRTRSLQKVRPPKAKSTRSKRQKNGESGQSAARCAVPQRIGPTVHSTPRLRTGLDHGYRDTDTLPMPMSIPIPIGALTPTHTESGHKKKGDHTTNSWGGERADINRSTTSCCSLAIRVTEGQKGRVEA